MALRFNALYPRRAIDVTPTPAEIRDRATWVVEHFEGKMWQGTAVFSAGRRSRHRSALRRWRELGGRLSSQQASEPVQRHCRQV